MPKFTPTKLTKHSWEFYTIWGQEHLTEQEMREEYQRLRKAVNARLKTIGRSSLAGSSTYYKEYKDGFPAWSRLTAEQRAQKFSELGHVASAKTSSLTGLRETRAKTIKTLQARGFDYVNETNIDRFIDMITAYKEFVGPKKYKYIEYYDYLEQAFSKTAMNKAEFRQLFESNELDIMGDVVD